MNFLIGIDVDGGVRGVEVLYHHEPIFMHGLGPQPFLDFLTQYAGHGITEQIVVGKGRSDNDVTYFDGVTKATVSVPSRAATTSRRRCKGAASSCGRRAPTPS